MYLIIEKILKMSLQNKYYQRKFVMWTLRPIFMFLFCHILALSFWARHLISLSISSFFRWPINCLGIGGEQLKAI